MILDSDQLHTAVDSESLEASSPLRVRWSHSHIHFMPLAEPLEEPAEQVTTVVSPERRPNDIRRVPMSHEFVPEEVEGKQKWLGHVTDLLSDGFRARFHSDEFDRKEIVAEFDFEELSKDDQQAIHEGAPLVWAIFRERRKGGLEQASVLYLRRLPTPSRSSLEKSKEKLDAWFGDLGGNTASA